ncbi:MAG: UxaA family hydrolase, partial [Verrucomicrobiales bacterium]
AASLARALREGADPGALPEFSFQNPPPLSPPLFKNFDGLRILTHGLGCGGTREDARSLCGLLAGYVTHPNVAGATVLSLGCQNAEVSILEEEIARRDPAFAKPLAIFVQQKSHSEKKMLGDAIRETMRGIARADRLQRAPAPLSKLTIGVECGGSDGFSGISANPAIGRVADLLVALGGKAILSEFPELCGAEQNLIDRCVSPEIATRFMELMRAYHARAEAVGSHFSMNPSPGNIRDGLITDAIKSAGAARKGGTSPVVDVIDYPGIATGDGLSLLCTPGNDVESTTALAGAHANLVLFSTGMGTPTGTAVSPTIKISSNTATARKHPDMIDFDAGPVLDGARTIEETGDDLLEFALRVASGEQSTCAEALGQHDFLPWKRGVSL